MKRVARALAKVLAGILVTVALVFVSVVVALNTQWGRQKLAGNVNAMLADSFQGSVEIRDIGGVSFDGVTNVDARIVDHAGRTVVVLANLDVNVALVPLLYQLLTDGGAVTEIALDVVELDHARVHWIETEDGVPSIAKAFEPRRPSPPSETTTELRIGSVRLRHVWLHGRAQGTPIDADVNELVGSLTVAESLKVTIAGAHVDIRALPMQVNPSGKVSASLNLPLGAQTAKPDLKLSFAGQVLRARTRLEAELEGQAIVAKLDAPSIEAATIAQLVPELALRAPIALSVAARGTLERPRVNVGVRLEQASVEANADVNLEQRVATIGLTVRGLDPSAIEASAPPGSLALDGGATVEFPPAGELMMRYWLRTPAQKYGSLPLPRTSVRGSATATPSKAWSLQGSLQIQEPGAATSVDYRVHSNESAPVIEASSSSELINPRRLAELVPGLNLAGELSTEMRYELVSGQIDARARARLWEVTTPDVLARDVRLEASARGTLERPSLKLDARMGRLAVGGRSYRGVGIDASGTPEKLHVRARAAEPVEIAANTVIALKPDLTLGEPQLRIEDGKDGALSVAGESITLKGGAVVVEGMKIEAPDGGRAFVSLVYGRSVRRLDVRAENFDLQRALGPLELGFELPSGSATLEARYDRAGPTGFLRGRLSDVGYRTVKGISADVDAELRRGALHGSLDAHWRGSELSLVMEDVALPKMPPASWNDFEGRIAARGHLLLERLGPVYEMAKVPWATAAGEVTVDMALSHPRDDPAEFTASIEAKEVGLRGIPPKASDPNGDVRTEIPWSIADVNLDLRLRADEASRRMTLSARVGDDEGWLAMTQASAELPPEASVRHFSDWPAWWQRAEVDANIWLLPRRLSQWPDMLRVAGLEGTASSSLHLSGTYGAPRARWMGRIEDFGTADQPEPELDVAFSGSYEPRRGAVWLGAQSGSREVAAIQGRWKGDVLSGLSASAQQPLEVHVSGRLSGFPIAALPFAATQHLAGHLNGELGFEGLHAPIAGNLRVWSDDLSIEKVRLKQLRLDASVRGERVESDLLLLAGRQGRLAASVAGRAAWADGLDTSALNASLKARDFQLRTLRPLLAGTVSGLEGRLNAELSGRLTGDDPQLRGHVVVREGAAQLPSLGQLLRDIEARVNVEPDRVVLSSFKAKGITGAVSATGSAELSGASVRSAHAEIEIAEGEKLPLTLEGVNWGDAWGKVALDYRAGSGRRQRLDVDVQHFELQLPAATPRGVQGLEPAKHIEVGYAPERGQFVEIPLQPIEREAEGPPSRWLIQIALRDVALHKGAGIDIALRGDLKARLGRKTRLEGRIDLTGGELDISGKQFAIESGSLTFNKTEPEQGIVVATARWESPLEYTVYAEYAGTLAEGELTLRSEPPLTEDEVLSLLLFGEPTGSFGARSQSEAATAISVAGGTVASGLNRALDDISSLDVSTRVDTSTGEARPELVVQVTPRLSARVTQAIGEPAPGQSPDRTFLTLDFRLFRRWSLSAQVGDEGGSTLDMIWRYRY